MEPGEGARAGPTAVVTRKVAIADPPDTIEANPIHGAVGAARLGYAGALVAGIHTYGWATAAVLDLYGDAWLERGWGDVVLRRPVYPGDELTTTVTPLTPAEATLCTAKADGTVVLDGTVGLGDAPWLGELELPTRRTAELPAPAVTLQRMLLETAPVGQDYRPMAVDATAGSVRAWVRTRLEDDDPLWHEGEHPYLHPAFLAGQMTPLFRHSYLYGPAIHVRTQIQHLTAARAGQCLTVAARLHAAYERKGHHYHESDCMVLGAEGEELMAERHTGIFTVAPRDGR